MDDKGLTDKQKRFCELYVIELNGTKAYMEAYPGAKADSTARTNASKLLTNTNIQDYVKELQSDLSNLCGVTALSQILFFKNLMTSGETTTREKIDGAKEINKMLGFYATEKSEVLKRFEQPLFGPIDDERVTGFNITISDPRKG